jgi:hypothetical protein
MTAVLIVQKVFAIVLFLIFVSVLANMFFITYEKGTTGLSYVFSVIVQLCQTIYCAFFVSITSDYHGCKPTVFR